MKASDLLKITNAGFMIIRADEHNLKIKFKSGQQDWKDFEKGFKSKAALRRRMNELLEDKLIVED